jgi:hypothetical protein
MEKGKEHKEDSQKKEEGIKENLSSRLDILELLSKERSEIIEKILKRISGLEQHARYLAYQNQQIISILVSKKEMQKVEVQEGLPHIPRSSSSSSSSSTN